MKHTKLIFSLVVAIFFASCDQEQPDVDLQEQIKGELFTIEYNKKAVQTEIDSLNNFYIQKYGKFFRDTALAFENYNKESGLLSKDLDVLSKKEKIYDELLSLVDSIKFNDKIQAYLRLSFKKDSLEVKLLQQEKTIVSLFLSSINYEERDNDALKRQFLRFLRNNNSDDDKFLFAIIDNQDEFDVLISNSEQLEPIQSAYPLYKETEKQFILTTKLREEIAFELGLSITSNVKSVFNNNF